MVLAISMDIEMIVNRKVCQLGPGRLEYETNWGGRELRTETTSLSHRRLSEISRKHLNAENPDADTPFIKRCISRQIWHDGNAYREGEESAQAIAIHKPRIICDTAPIICTM
ncbi:unnamed protein product [Enterobius vermicularis]|uniref:Uncharacterized protein n=1 Tax=Enterobius vermicularis TaxID=51028 RepID=A0A0N4VI74_ENTVE|nr:unnamed protein product [Enterobius vermicularis]